MPHLDKLKSMELTMEEAKEIFPWKFDSKGKLHQGDKVPKYPDGLELGLEGAILKKLGVKITDFAVGQEMTINALVVVEKVKNEERLGEDPEIMVRLQIKELAVGDPEGNLEDQLFKS